MKAPLTVKKVYAMEEEARWLQQRLEDEASNEAISAATSNRAQRMAKLEATKAKLCQQLVAADGDLAQALCCTGFRSWLKASGPVARASRLFFTCAKKSSKTAVRSEEEGRSATIAFIISFWMGRSQPRIQRSAARPLIHWSSHITRMSARARLILRMSYCTASVLAVEELKRRATTRSTLRKSILM